MLIYNVTVNVEDPVHDEWLAWMKEVHIPAVMATGYFLEYRMCRVLAEEDTGKTYAIQYSCKNKTDLEEYQDREAPRLQAEHRKKFQDKFVAFRTILEVV